MNIDAKKFQTLDLVRCQLHFEFHRTFHPGVSVFLQAKAGAVIQNVELSGLSKKMGKSRKFNLRSRTDHTFNFHLAPFQQSQPSVSETLPQPQGWRKCSSAVATLRAEQGPCEPSKGFVSKFGEPERAWASQREPERARWSQREPNREPEGARVSQREPEWARES